LNIYKVIDVPNIFEGNMDDAAGRFAVVVARFNRKITSGLLDGAIDTLTVRGVAEERIDVVWVPGAFELPAVAARLARTGRYAAVICLGAVIKGETSHDEHINRAVSLTLAQLGVDNELPIMFGLLTCDTLEQAIARSGLQAGTRGKDGDDSRVGNKGSECAEAALEMVSLMAKIV